LTAGKGAEEQRQLAADRIERLKRQLQQAERDERAWAAGAQGEVRVAQELGSFVAKGWHILHDVHWPGRPKANLDHVLIGPGGVLIIDTKNWTGQIVMRAGVIYQNGRSRQKELTSASQQAGAVAALLEPGHRRHVQSWLCLVGHPHVSFVASCGVRVKGLAALRDAIDILPVVWDPSVVQSVYLHLRKTLGSTDSPSLLTTAQLSASPPRALDKAGKVGASTSVSVTPGARGGNGTAHRRQRSQPNQSHPVSVAKRLLGCLVLLFTIAFALFVVGALIILFNTLISPAVPATPSHAPSSPATTAAPPG
jgi:hypothetical protein